MDEHLDGDSPDAHVIADGQTAETNGGYLILHERSSSVERWDSKETVLILSLFLLDVKSDAGTPVQETCNPLEVLRDRPVFEPSRLAQTSSPRFTR